MQEREQGLRRRCARHRLIDDHVCLESGRGCFKIVGKEKAQAPLGRPWEMSCQNRLLRKNSKTR